MWNTGLPPYLIAGLIGMATIPTYAVMPPYHEARAALERATEFQELRSQADHAVEVEVTKAEVNRAEGDQCPSRENLDLEARVLSSTRGYASPGTTLRIQYTRSLYRCPGPIREENPSLALGQRVFAYLNCQADLHCVPAASAASFIDESAFLALITQRREDFERESAKMKGVNPPPDELQRDNAVFFRRSSLELQPADSQLLRHHVKYLRAETKARIRLLSYAEPSMSRESALVISEKRALVVQRFLVSEGVSPWRIEIKALGRELTPVPPNIKTTGRNTSLQGVVVIDYDL